MLLHARGRACTVQRPGLRIDTLDTAQGAALAAPQVPNATETVTKKRKVHSMGTVVCACELERLASAVGRGRATAPRPRSPRTGAQRLLHTGTLCRSAKMDVDIGCLVRYCAADGAGALGCSRQGQGADGFVPCLAGGRLRGCVQLTDECVLKEKKLLIKGASEGCAPRSSAAP